MTDTLREPEDRNENVAGNAARSDGSWKPVSIESISLANEKNEEPLGLDRLVGTTLAERFEIVEVLGYGGMSVVYKAKQMPMNRFVAIKTLKIDVRPATVARFEQEIQTLCKLNHPNIVTVYDYVLDANHHPYVVMDYLRGKDLTYLAGQLDIDRFEKIFTQVCSALDHAHKNGIIHRDLKPGNIVLLSDEIDFVKVVDFGLAKMMQEDLHLTKSGELWGSPPFMSPEQWLSKRCDARSDIYSLGTVMYRMLTGKEPFEANSLYELAHKHLNDTAQSICELNSEVSESIEAVVFKAMEKEPDNRFQSAMELSEALVLACKSPNPSRSQTFVNFSGGRIVSRASIEKQRAALVSPAKNSMGTQEKLRALEVSDNRFQGKWNILMYGILAGALVAGSVLYFKANHSAMTQDRSTEQKPVDGKTTTQKNSTETKHSSDSSPAQGANSQTQSEKLSARPSAVPEHPKIVPAHPTSLPAQQAKSPVIKRFANAHKNDSSHIRSTHHKSVHTESPAKLKNQLSSKNQNLPRQFL